MMIFPNITNTPLTAPRKASITPQDDYTGSRIHADINHCQITNELGSLSDLEIPEQQASDGFISYI